MARIRLDGHVLTVPEGLIEKRTLSLDSLRLVYLIAATSGRWWVVTSSQGLTYIDLDGQDAETFAGLAEEISSAVLGRGSTSGLWLALADYDGGSALLPFSAMKRARLDLVPALTATREVRLQRRKAWLSGSASVELKGSLGACARLDASGFHRGKRSIAWRDVGSVQTETTNGIRTDLLLLPHGSSGGMFNFRRFRYSLPFVPGKKKELFAAECFFWLQRTAPAAGARTLGQALSG